MVSKNDLIDILLGKRKSLAASAHSLRDASPGMPTLIDTISTTATGNCKCSNEGNEVLPSPALRWGTGSPKKKGKEKKIYY